MRKNLLIAVLTLSITVTFGQSVQAQNGNASAVQLPTFSYFTAPTTVSVPDRGGTYMGGVKRSASGRIESGAPLLPFKNRAIGNESSASSISVHAYIHDFEAMDEAILGSAPQGNNAGGTFVRHGNRTIPFRYVATDPKSKKITGAAATAKTGTQVAVRKRPKTQKGATDIDAPLFLSGQQSQALGNVQEKPVRTQK